MLTFDFTNEEHGNEEHGNEEHGNEEHGRHEARTDGLSHRAAAEESNQPGENHLPCKLDQLPVPMCSVVVANHSSEEFECIFVLLLNLRPHSEQLREEQDRHPNGPHDHEHATEHVQAGVLGRVAAAHGALDVIIRHQD